MADSIETEWQFDAPDLERVRTWLSSQPSHAPLTFEQVRDREQVDSYFDAADWRLFQAGFSLRRRRSGEEYELTLKALGAASAGPIARREISQASADGDIFDGDGPVSNRVRLVVGRRSLQRLFDVRTRRRTFAVRRAGDQVAVVELDETTVAPTTAVPSTFRRVEVEISAGIAAGEVQSFVDAMVEACALTPTSASKYEMGLRASGLDPESALVFGPTERDPELGTAAFAFAWLRQQWSAFLRHEPGTRLGEGIEALHQMRVATRRLRAAIRVFAPVLPEAFIRLRDELQWVGHELGAVRDLDVQIEELEARRAAGSWDESSALAPLVAAVDRTRSEERQRLIDLLNSTRYDALVDEFSHLLRTGAPATDPTMAGVGAFAPAILRQRYRRLRRDIRALHALSEPREYHAVRIRAKQLRYSLEIFGEFYGATAQRFAVALKAVQDHFGEHQDADVGIDRFRELVRSEGSALPPETLVVLGRLMEQYAQRMVALRASASPLLGRLRHRWPPLARAIAVLASEQPRDPDVSPAPQAPSGVAAEPGAQADARSRPIPPPLPSLGAPPAARADEAGGTLTSMRHLFQGD